MMESRIATVCGKVSCLRPVWWASCAFALMIGLVSSPSVARAESDDRFWSDYLLDAGTCEAALNDAVSEGTRCLLGTGLKLVLEESLRFAEASGKRTFGPHFQVVGNLSYSPVSSKFGIDGDIEMVLPFAGAGSSGGRPGASSFFIQQGVTRSWDGSGSGLFRNDLRHGVVRRFRVSDAPDADIVGISAFHLLNAERGHRVLAPGLDYAGRWGLGSFRYFVPTTDWRQGSSGYQERALEGLELGMRFDLTTTLRLNTVGYRWRAEDGSNRWDTGARVDLDWRPHPWLNFSTGYDGIGGGKRSTSFQVAFRLPFGGPPKPPAWEGLGVAAGHSPPTAEALWRPTEDIGPIRVAKRQSASALVGKARVRFLQDAVGSGEAVRLEVLLPAVAPEDIRVVVQLVPGDGKNPVVPGEDFVDEPVETTIRKGTASSTVSITLLRNDNMEQPRSLSATVSMAS
ncbi:MAG: hypothetical protein OXE53_09500 [Deltaproteobacteria bacterium]|nr:hypothetical protein [Deltaproteobacteria bacterium]